MDLKGIRENKEFARFVGAGCINTGVGFAVYCSGILLGLNYVVANSIAWIISVILGFYLNSRFCVSESPTTQIGIADATACGRMKPGSGTVWHRVSRLRELLAFPGSSSYLMLPIEAQGEPLINT